MKLQMGATLQNGKYQLNQFLGRESLGATYIATQTLLQQPVVIKTLDPSLQVTQSFPHLKARFIEETRLLARCQHPSLVRILDFFEEDHLPFLVMDYIPGQTLHDRVSTTSAPPLTEAEAIHYMRQIASALSVAHRVGLVHRNIRPEVIVRRQGTNLGILVGFGLAHDVAIPDLLPDNPFAPPERNWSRDNPFAIDLYSLASTLYYLLSGQPTNGTLSLEQYSWSPATKQAIFRGLTHDPQWQVQTVDEWLRLLPNTTLPLMSVNTLQAQPLSVPSKSSNGNNGSLSSGHALPPIPAANVTVPPAPVKVSLPEPPTHPAIVNSPTVNSPTVNSSAANSRAGAAKLAVPVKAAIVTPNRLPKVLMFAIVTAGAIGLGFGVTLRLSAAKAPGSSILNPVQPFAEKDWKGTLTPNDRADIFTETAGSAKSSSPSQNYIDPEVDQRSASPSPNLRKESEYPSPIQPRYPRSQSNPISPAPIQPAPVKPAPEPVETAPEPSDSLPVGPVTPPVTPPAPIEPAPVKPSTRDVEPSPPLPRSNGGE